MFEFAPLSRILPYWPEKLFGPPGGKLDEIGVTDFDIWTDTDATHVSGTTAWLREIEFKLPHSDVIVLALLETNGFTQIPFTVVTKPFSMKVTNLTAALRIRTPFLKAVHHDNAGNWVSLLDANNKPAPVEIVLSNVDVAMTTEGEMQVDFAPNAATLTMTPFQFGNSGIVLEMKGLELFLSKDASPDGFKGVKASSAELYVSGISHAPNTTNITDLAIGSSGFSGKILASWDHPNGVGLLFGVPYELESVSLDIQQNVPVGASIKAKLTIPFFNKEADVEIGFGPDGEVTVAIDSSNGIASLNLPGVMSIELDSLKFEVKDGHLVTTLSGKLTPEFGGLNWPAFEIKDLQIGHDGQVKLSGGWLDLPKQYNLNFHGFKLNITQFGCGHNPDNTRWIGFSGKIKLVDGLPDGASVKGLRITANSDWSHPKFSFEGIGVELEIPDVLYFKGDVDYKQLQGPAPGGGEVHRFDGDIVLKLEALDFEINGTLVCGSANGYNFFALYVDVELPTGIPVCGLGIYGFAGLLALQMKPDKGPDEPWYGIGDNAAGWYDKPQVGIEDIKTKWINAKGSKAFGAGVTIGTLPDNGHTFNGRMLLAIILPGPVVMLQGKANILKDRKELDKEAMFRSIAVFDKPGGSILFGVDADYKYDDSGSLIDISGGLEAYYSWIHQNDWHLYLGMDEPRENRIQARVLDLFDANAYFMLDAHSLSMGSWVGFDKSWKFSVLSVSLQAWMENNAKVSFKPLHLHGDLWMHGSADLKVMKYGLSLSIDARIAADVFTPAHLLGELNVAIKLPKPLKSASADIRLEWGPKPKVPPIPIVLKDVAIEHFKSSATWPLPVGRMTLPDYGVDGFLASPAPGGGDISNIGVVHGLAGPSDQFPVVPMDCRPGINFARNVWDNALIATFPQPADPPWERIGDPARDEGPANIRYAVEAIYLDKFDNGAWQQVAATTSNATVNKDLYGAWQVTTAIGSNKPAQNRLSLWSKSGYDLYRNVTSNPTAQFAGAFGDFPCFETPAPWTSCLTFDALNSKEHYASVYTHRDNASVMIGICQRGADDGSGFPTFVSISGAFQVQPAPSTIPNVTQMLCPSPYGGIWINFLAPPSNIKVTAVSASSPPIEAWVTQADGTKTGPYAFTDDVCDIPLADIRNIVLDNGSDVCLVEICGTFADPALQTAAYTQMSAHAAQAASLWQETGNVLDPFCDYRLRIHTSAQMVGGNNANPHQMSHAYFRTSGPPGIGHLSIPISGNANFDSGLDSLDRYVQQTVPPTVPAPGELPLSPRPVYCGYDVGVDFNENYVSLMYKKAGRNLSIILYDANNFPARDSSGALAISNPWGAQPTATPSPTDQAWLDKIQSAPCVQPVNPATMPADETMRQPVELDPDTLYDARLVPMLLCDDFSRFTPGAQAVGPTGNLGRWWIADAVAGTTNGAPSCWQVQVGPMGSSVVQTGAIGPLAPGGPAPAGTILVVGQNDGLPGNDPSQPLNWSDYRVEVSLIPSAVAGATAGVAFRCTASNGFYLLLLRDYTTAELLRIDSGGVTSLASGAYVYAPGQVCHVAVEALGGIFAVIIDGAVILEVGDTTLPLGGIALYASSGAGSAFSQIRVFDLSHAAGFVYHFPFTTSDYLNFAHHMHSFEDGCWRAAGQATPALTQAAFDAQVAQAILASDIRTDIATAENAAFDVLVNDILLQQAGQNASRVEISKIERNGDIVAFLVRGPQPFGFKRALFGLQRNPTLTPKSLSPLGPKIVAATLHAMTPDDEIITLMLEDTCDLSGYRLEMRDYSAVAAGNTIPVDDLDDPTSAWLPVYTFPQGFPVQRRGHLVSISSGAPVNPPQPRPRTTQIFRTPTGQTGTRILDVDAADLRLLAPAPIVGSPPPPVHARRFLQDADYAEVDFRILRKADETAFFIFPAQTGQVFTAASYRLFMASLLHNVFDSTAQVLAQNGNSDAEVAALDFSWTSFN